MDSEYVEGFEPVFSGRFQECADLIGGEGLYLFPVHAGRVHGFRDVAGHQSPPEGLLERPVQDHMQVLYCP